MILAILSKTAISSIYKIRLLYYKHLLLLQLILNNVL